MRPIKVEFQAFGPYAGLETVDFEAVALQGLFLICGKTGIGKTMILDAMTFALYGKSSGNGRDDLEAMRCTRADDDTPTFVKFEFENNGEYYLFERRLEKKRVKLSASYNLMKKDENGVWRVMFENPKEKLLNEKAEEIIGLTYNQFRQVIVLPQGQFEKFLTSGSDEKEKILSYFCEEAEERRNSLRETRERIIRSLSEEQCETTGQLELKIAGLKEQEEALTKEFKKHDYDNDIRSQQEILAVIKNLNGLKEAFDKRKNDEEKAKKAAQEIKEAADEAAAALKEHLKKESDNEDKKALVIRYEGKRGDYEGIDKAEKELALRSKKAKDLKMAADEAKKNYDAFAPLLKKLRNEFEALKSKHSLLLDSYIAGITGELAEELKEGSPCPVCGSTNHPKKAPKSPDSVSREQVDAKKEEEDQKYKDLQDKISEQEKAKAVLDEKLSDAVKADTDALEAGAVLDAMRKNLVPGIGTLKELNDSIDGLNKQIKAYADRKKRLEDGESRGREAYGRALAAIETAEGESKAAGKAYEKAREEAKQGLKGEAEPDEQKCHDAIDHAIQAKEEYGKSRVLLENDIKRLTDKLKTLKEEGKDIEERIRTAEQDHAFAKRLRGDSGTGLQRYVLGIMFSSVVAAANRMLEMVHGGRYRLYRSDDKAQGSNKRGLELKVFDNLSGEHDGRFVSTLSGGEKFLVSLALSIGMSTVAAKSGISMEALFIDEGFGSLDDDSIDDAMNVLGSIQEANGMVGIISHVAILQERIPNKLKVVSDERGSHIIQTTG